MKKLFFFWLLAVSTLQMTAQTSDRLAAYYNFDNDTTRVIYDQSGNNSNGIVGGDSVLGCGVSGRAFRLDGIKDNIILVGSANNHFGLADFSVSFFIKATSGSGIKDIIGKRILCSGSDRGFSIRYTPNSKILTCELVESVTKNGNVSTKLDLSQCWQHVTLVRRASSSLLYVNGTLRAETVAAARVNLTNSGILRVAGGPCLAGGGNTPFGGLLDELRVYSKSLSDEEVLELYESVLPDHLLTQDTLIFLGGSVATRISNTCVSNFLWQPTTGVSNATMAEPILQPTQTTTYKIAFRDAQCVATDSIRITVIDPDSLNCKQVFLPKAFSPNGFGPTQNEKFGLSNPYAVKEIISLEILDQWGGKMFSTADVFEQWDGTFLGSPVQPGIYLYRVRLICKGKEEVQTGSFTLLR